MKKIIMIGTLNKVGIFNIKIIKQSAVEYNAFDYTFILNDGRRGHIHNTLLGLSVGSCYVIRLRCLNYDIRLRGTNCILMNLVKMLGKK